MVYTNLVKIIVFPAPYVILALNALAIITGTVCLFKGMLVRNKLYQKSPDDGHFAPFMVLMRCGDYLLLMINTTYANTFFAAVLT